MQPLSPILLSLKNWIKYINPKYNPNVYKLFNYGKFKDKALVPSNPM